MPQVKSKLVTIVLKDKELTKRETERIVNAIKFGIKAWVKAAEAIIPVYSGASRASLDQLAAVVGMNISTTPTTNAVKSLGPAAIAQRIAQARAESSGGIRVNKKSITFFFESSLQWLVDNETGEANDGVAPRLITPIPYNFIAFANRVAQGVIVKRLRGRTIDLRRIFDVQILR